MVTDTVAIPPRPPLLARDDRCPMTSHPPRMVGVSPARRAEGSTRVLPISLVMTRPRGPDHARSEVGEWRRVPVFVNDGHGPR